MAQVHTIRVEYRRDREVVSLGDVRRRVERAILTLPWLKDDEANWLRAGNRSSWPPSLEASAKAVAQAKFKGIAHPLLKRWRLADFDDYDRGALSNDDARPARFQPKRADIDDCLTALEWFAALKRLPARPRPRRRGYEPKPDDVQLLIIRVANGESWAQVASKAGCSDYQAEKAHADAIKDCWRIANGLVRLIDASIAQREAMQRAVDAGNRPEMYAQVDRWKALCLTKHAAAHVRDVIVGTGKVACECKACGRTWIEGGT